jgi:chemotaxis regulatin CheY-phosphate phosphatase CheZ
MPDLETICSVKEIPACLAELTDALEAVCQNSEPDFLQLGEELRAVSTNTTFMTQQIYAAVDLIEDAIERNALRRVGELARKLFAEVRDIQDEADRGLKRMPEVARRMGAIHRLCAGTETISTFLRVIGFNMAIKSAHSRNAQEMFQGFAEEAAEVAASISAITGLLGDDAQTVQAAQISAHAEITADSVRLQNLVRAADSAFQNAVDATELLITHSRNVLQNAAAHSQTIAQQVSEIVVGVQFHDSMSQKIAHISENLREIMMRCNDEYENGKADRLNCADSFLDSQAVRLQLIITESWDIYHKNIQAFEKIDTEAERLVQSLDVYDNSYSSKNAHDSGIFPVKTAPDDPFSALQTALQSLHQVLLKGQKLTERIERAVVYAAAQTTRFAKQARKVRRISHETHIMALNAGVKALRLGNQRQTFTVMAQEITSIAKQSQEFVTEIEAILKSVAALNPKNLNLRNQAQENSPEPAAQAGVITMLDNHIQAVSDAFYQLKKKSSEAYKIIGILRQKVIHVKTDLSFCTCSGGNHFP